MSRNRLKRNPSRRVRAKAEEWLKRADVHTPSEHADFTRWCFESVHHLASVHDIVIAKRGVSYVLGCAVMARAAANVMARNGHPHELLAEAIAVAKAVGITAGVDSVTRDAAVDGLGTRHRSDNDRIEGVPHMDSELDELECAIRAYIEETYRDQADLAALLLRVLDEEVNRVRIEMRSDAGERLH